MNIAAYIPTAATESAIAEITRRDGRVCDAAEVERRAWAARAFIERGGLSVLDADGYMDVTLALFAAADFMPPERRVDLMQFANDVALLRRCAAQLLQPPQQDQEAA